MFAVCHSVMLQAIRRFPNRISKSLYLFQPRATNSHATHAWGGMSHGIYQKLTLYQCVHC